MDLFKFEIRKDIYYTCSSLEDIFHLQKSKEILGCIGRMICTDSLTK